MNRFFWTFLSAVLLAGNISFAGTFAYDSAGITKKGGKSYVVHLVDEGETLYSLCRRYNVKLDDLYNENPEARNGLNIGQKILVPLKEAPDVPKDAKVHVVKPSETLYSIARLYDVSTQEIRSWNNLSGNSIGVGDKLIIKKGNSPTVAFNQLSPETTTATANGRKTHTVQPSETLYSLSRQYDVNITELREWNNIQGTEISVGQVLVVSAGNDSNERVQPDKHSSMLPGKEEPPVVAAVMQQQPSETKDSSKASTALYNVDEDVKKTYENKKIQENGFAEVIEGSGDTKKYLALHRTAPVGTIMQVRNEMNNQTVFVRVVGTIPDTGNNKNVLIKISRKAFDRLGSVDAKFPVELSYIP